VLHKKKKARDGKYYTCNRSDCDKTNRLARHNTVTKDLANDLSSETDGTEGIVSA
jgi:hypothetical protein